MSEKERALYRLIRALPGPVPPAPRFDRTVADLSCGQQKLVATGKQVVARGWRLVLAESEREGSADEDGDAPVRTQVLPALRDGMACQVAGADIKALKTMPPKPLYPGRTGQAMKGVARFVTDPRLKQKLKDTTGIGTEATRGQHHQRADRPRLYREEGALHPRIGCGVHADRRRARGDCRPAPPPSGNRRWT